MLRTILFGGGHFLLELRARVINDVHRGRSAAAPLVHRLRIPGLAVCGLASRLQVLQMRSSIIECLESDATATRNSFHHRPLRPARRLLARHS